MQIASVDTKAGVAICCAPSRMAAMSPFPWLALRCTFSSSTVVSSTTMPTASASPPRVMTLSVWPRRYSVMTDTRRDSGIDRMTISVLRQLPRNRRIMRPVRQAAMAPSVTTPRTAARTKSDWSKSSFSSKPAGAAARIAGRDAWTRLTISSVEAPPDFRMVRSTDRRPVDLFDRHLVEGRDRAGAAVETDDVVARPHLGGAGWQGEVLRRERRIDISGREALGQQGRRIQIDHDLARLAAIRQRQRQPLDRRQCLPHAVQAVVVELGFRPGRAAQAQLQNGDARGVIAQDKGRLRTGGHKPQDGLRDRRELRNGPIDVCSGLEEHLDHADAAQGLRFNAPALLVDSRVVEFEDGVY